MLFNSYQFIFLFLPIALIGYFVLGRFGNLAPVIWLALASLVFYSVSNWQFVLLLLTLIRRVFHSRVMYDVVVSLLRDYVPAGQDFVIRNLNALVDAHQRAQVFSLVMLLITSTGIFMPLEVALNRIWGFRNNRSYIANQLVSFGLTFASGSLA